LFLELVEFFCLSLREGGEWLESQPSIVSLLQQLSLDHTLGAHFTLLFFGQFPWHGSWCWADL